MNFQYVNHNGQLKKISNPESDKYVLKQNWHECDFGEEWEINSTLTKQEKIKEIQDVFNTAIEQTINYKDKPFKISYCTIYQTFEGRYTDDVMTMRIWDATEKSYLDLNKTEFVELKLMLAMEYEIKFQEMKQAIAELL